MKISSLNKDLVTAVYDHEGEPLTMKIDRNIVTPSFLRHIATLKGENGDGPEEGKEMTWAETADALERNAKISAAILSSDMIREWDLTEDDEVTPIQIIEDELYARLPPVFLVRLCSFAMEQAQTVKKTTIETMPDTSLEKVEDDLHMQMIT
jgi:hypothetical protein